MSDKIATSETTDPRRPDVRKRALKIDLTPDQRARFDLVMEKGHHPTQAEALMALVDRALEDPIDAYATQIGQLNAWVYQLTRNDPNTRMSAAHRKAVRDDIRQVVDHICGWDAD